VLPKLCPVVVSALHKILHLLLPPSPHPNNLLSALYMNVNQIAMMLIIFTANYVAISTFLEDAAFSLILDDSFNVTIHKRNPQQ
jgi:hypothetical protein